MAKQVMIVDDDRNNLEFMQLALVFEGYDVRVSTTGRELRHADLRELPGLIANRCILSHAGRNIFVLTWPDQEDIFE